MDSAGRAEDTSSAITIVSDKGDTFTIESVNRCLSLMHEGRDLGPVRLTIIRTEGEDDKLLVRYADTRNTAFIGRLA